MAIGRRILSTHDAILPWDPAVDLDKCDEKYQTETPRFAAKYAAIKDGQAPTVFTLCPPSEGQKRVLADMDQESFGFYESALRCGILGHKNYVLIDGDVTVEAPQPDRKDRPPLGECASVDWVNQMRMPHNDIRMLGAIVWGMSEARPLP